MAVKSSFGGSFLDSVFINKERCLGRGSYGAVYEGSYQELPCAIKVMHTSFFGCDQDSHQKLEERFQSECALLSRIKHPCIVQFLGITQDPSTSLPALVMELMDESLTAFLERSESELPLHLQVNFGHDVSLALAYLHSLGITHRDLSSNNVLLLSGTRVKVTDFGVSVFKSSKSRSMATKCPGTQAYMAPECLGGIVQYTQSIDCFSFGVLLVQIITRIFPAPTEHLEAFTMSGLFGQQNPHETYMRVVPEVNRRQNHIRLIDGRNPLKEILTMCLSDRESSRPTAHELCRSLAAIKEGHLYNESLEKSPDYQSVVIQECDATRNQLQSTASELNKTRSEAADHQRENERLQLSNRFLEQQVSQLSQSEQELRIRLLDAEEKQRQAKGGLKGFLFGEKDRGNAVDVQEKNSELRAVRNDYLSSLKKMEALQNELQQKNRDIASKELLIRSKSDQIKNVRDKMDALEVDLGIERHRTSSANEDLRATVEQLEQTCLDLEESKEEVNRLEQTVEKLRRQIKKDSDSAKSDKATLEEVCRIEVSQREEKLQEQSREIEGLKSELKSIQETLDEFMRDQSASHLGTKSGEPNRSQLVVRNRKKKQDSKSIKQLLRYLINRDSSSSDSENSLDDFEKRERHSKAKVRTTAVAERDLSVSSSGDHTGSASPVLSQEIKLDSSEERKSEAFPSLEKPSTPSPVASYDLERHQEGCHSSDKGDLSEDDEESGLYHVTSSEDTDHDSEPYCSPDIPSQDPCSSDSESPLSNTSAPNCEVYGPSPAVPNIVIPPFQLGPPRVVPSCQPLLAKPLSIGRPNESIPSSVLLISDDRYNRTPDSSTVQRHSKECPIKTSPPSHKPQIDDRNPTEAVNTCVKTSKNSESYATVKSQPSSHETQQLRGGNIPICRSCGCKDFMVMSPHIEGPNSSNAQASAQGASQQVKDEADVVSEKPSSFGDSQLGTPHDQCDSWVTTHEEHLSREMQMSGQSSLPHSQQQSESFLKEHSNTAGQQHMLAVADISFSENASLSSYSKESSFHGTQSAVQSSVEPQPSQAQQYIGVMPSASQSGTVPSRAQIESTLPTTSAQDQVTVIAQPQVFTSQTSQSSQQELSHSQQPLAETCVHDQMHVQKSGITEIQHNAAGTLQSENTILNNQQPTPYQVSQPSVAQHVQQTPLLPGPQTQPNLLQQNPTHLQQAPTHPPLMQPSPRQQAPVQQASMQQNPTHPPPMQPSPIRQQTLMQQNPTHLHQTQLTMQQPSAQESPTQHLKTYPLSTQAPTQHPPPMYQATAHQDTTHSPQKQQATTHPPMTQPFPMQPSPRQQDTMHPVPIHPATMHPRETQQTSSQAPTKPAPTQPAPMQQNPTHLHQALTQPPTMQQAPTHPSPRQQTPTQQATMQQAPMQYNLPLEQTEHQVYPIQHGCSQPQGGHEVEAQFMNVQSPVTHQQANNNQPSGQTTLTSAYGGTDRHAQTHQFQTSMSLSAEQPHALTNVASHTDHRQTLTQSSQVAPQSSVPSSSDGFQSRTNGADAKMHSEQQVTSHVSNVRQSVNLPGMQPETSYANSKLEMVNFVQGHVEGSKTQQSPAQHPSMRQPQMQQPSAHQQQHTMQQPSGYQQQHPAQQPSGYQQQHPAQQPSGYQQQHPAQQPSGYQQQHTMQQPPVEQAQLQHPRPVHNTPMQQPPPQQPPVYQNQMPLTSTHQPPPYQPTEHHPTAHQPAAYQPTACQPTVYQPAAHQPTAHQPTMYQPTEHHHTGHQPAAHQPAAHQPTACQPTVYQTAEHQPTEHQPAVYQPTEHHHTGHQPAAHQPAAHQPTACQPTVYQTAEHQPTEHQSAVYQPTEHHHTGPQPAVISQNAEYMLNERSGQDYQRSQRPSEIPIHTAPHGRVDSAMLPLVMSGGGHFIQTTDSYPEQHPTHVGQTMMGAHSVISRRIPVPHAPTSPPNGDHTMPDTNPASVYVPQGPAPQSSTPCSTTDGNYSEHFHHAAVPNLSTPQPFQSAHNNTPHSTVTLCKRPENLIKGGHSATNLAGSYETAGAYGSPYLAQKSKTAPLGNYEQIASNNPRPNTSTHDVLSNVPCGQHQGASMVGQNPQPSMAHQFEIPQNMPQSQNVHYTTTSNPQAISDHNLQGQRTRYGGQHSFSSEDSMTSSPSANSFGTYSPQSSYGSHDQQSPPMVSKNNWSFNTPMDRQRHTFPRARPHPPHHSEMVAQQRRPIPSSAQQGSERVVSNPRAHTPSGTVHESCIQFKNISTEQERQRYSGMGHYEPSPEISLHPSMYGHRFHHQDCVRPPYHRSNSATTHPNYPRTWSEPRNMDRHHGSFRRQQFVRQPRPGTWTAPVPRFYCGDSDEVYYDDKHHYRYTEQHYPDQYFHQEQQHPHFAYSNAQQSYDSYAWQPVGPDSRYADQYPGGGSDPMNQHHQEPTPGQCHTYRQTPSKPAETYYEEYISQNKEEFVNVLGKSDHDEEYSVVLMQPQCVVDLSAPWAVIFAVCCRNPNCINALLEQLETKYSVDHISIVFDKNRQLMLDIPHEEARKQGYTILHSVNPIMITQSEASPPHKEFGAKADSIYPQRHHIWVHPQQIDNKTSCHLSLPLKLIGAKDCGKHFVLRSPQLMSPDRTTPGLHSRSRVHTQPQLPPLEESPILEDEPNETTFALLVEQKLAPRWKDFGTYIGVEQTAIQVIDQEHGGTTSLCQKLISVFNYWKRNKTEQKPTWKDLIAVVKRFDVNLAQEMESKLCSGQT